jgi:hypothetical protein
MGLRPLALPDWIEPDERIAVELAEKARLLRDHHPEVFAVLPEATESAKEVLEVLAAHLPARFPTLYRREGPRLTNLVMQETWDLAQPALHPLELAGRLVQEDLCLMARETTREVYRLVGAAVCFPTRWRLADKLGQPLQAIHAPVPGYDAQLAAPLERLFARLQPDKPVWRCNWSLVDDPTLFQPTGPGGRAGTGEITADNAGEKVWLRIERQTLRRLPRTQAIVFTIRVHVRPLHSLTRCPEQAARLAATLRALPEPMRVYKSLPPFLAAVVTWLDRLPAAR